MNIFLSIAGGDSFSDIYGIGQFLYVSLPIILGLITGKPLICLPQTYGPFKSRFAETIAKLICHKAYLLYSRDYDGIKITQKLSGNGKRKVKFGYDMGFGLEPSFPKSKIIDEIIQVEDEDAFATADKLTKVEGIFAGTSAGAAVWTALNKASALGKDKTVVTIVPDGGERYLSMI